MATTNDSKRTRSKSEEEDAELERLAAEEILKEAKRGKDRVERIGVMGWKKRPGANKVYLRNMMTNTIRSNKRKELPTLTCSKDHGNKHRYNEEALNNNKSSDSNTTSKHHSQSKKLKQYSKSHGNKIDSDRNTLLNRTHNKH